MYCKKCGNKLPDDANFCMKCGQAVDNETAPEVDNSLKLDNITKRILVCVVFGAAIVGAAIISMMFAKRKAAEKVLDTLYNDTVVTDSTASEAAADVMKDVEDTVNEAKQVVTEMVNIDEAEADFDVSRNSFISMGDDILYNPDLVPNVESFEVDYDFENVINTEDYSFEYMTEEAKDRLREDGFFVSGGYGSSEFFDEYEANRYSMRPNFITVDSLMHTYHLYFAHLLKNTEKNYLISRLTTVSTLMYEKSVSDYDKLTGTEWESAAARNVAYFAVALKLLGINIDVPEYVADVVNMEYDRCINEEGIYESAIMNGINEDYTQYRPRGYYEGDSELEKYFRTMMWYGRISYAQRDEDLNRSALLMALSLKNTCLKEWESIYLVTSFFAGESDDCTFYDYISVIESAYGNNVSVASLVGDDEGFTKYTEATKALRAPHITSIPVDMDEEADIICYRFMGQRFTIDEAIFTQLTFRRVKENDKGEMRMLPDTLDVAAALGSDVAYDILRQEEKTDYPNYDEQLAKVRTEFDNARPELWKASLYSCWIDTLRPLLEVKGEGYPQYMQSVKWDKKNLETFAGSYAELKHDTILYSKENMAEMGGGDEPDSDDRGYVDPQPIVYSRFALLSQKTKEGLKKFEMISQTDEDNLDKLYDMAIMMLTISEKELVNELPSEDEFEFIRCYGGDLEHFWLEVNKNDDYYMSYSDQAPCQIIADISTDPNGGILEVGTGYAQEIYVLINVDGKVKLSSGSVYSFYQFEQPLSEGRMTDSMWRNRFGYLDENYDYHEPDLPDQPEWTKDYRVFGTYGW